MAKKQSATDETTPDTTTAPTDAAPQPVADVAPVAAPVLTLLAKFPTKADGAKFHALQTAAHLSQLGVKTQMNEQGAEGEDTTCLWLVK